MQEHVKKREEKQRLKEIEKQEAQLHATKPPKDDILDNSIENMQEDDAYKKKHRG